MKFRKFFSTFKNDESGAVTVDWVVLTAAIVGVAIAVVAVIRPSVEGLATKIGDKIDTVEVPSE